MEVVRAGARRYRAERELPVPTVEPDPGHAGAGSVRLLSTRTDVVVVGGGVIGATIAWRVAQSGRQVMLVDPAVENSASWVAGGMLAPLTEAWPGEEDALELGAASLARWPEFADELAAAGHDPGLSEYGTLLLAADSADREAIGTLVAYLVSRGREATMLDGRQLRRLEPSIGPSVRCGLSMPGDLAVDNRKLLRALHQAGSEAGVLRRNSRVAGLHPVTLEDGSTMDSETVVLAAGAWSGRLHPALAQVIRPVKGEVLRLRPRASSLPPPRHTVRGLVQGRPVYLVPREDGELVLGATQYEAGFDIDPLVGGVRDLIADAERLLPGIADYALVEVAAGLRASSTDNLPLIGWLEPDVLVAAGHHRNGLLLAPITADAIGALLDGREPPDAVRPADPAREAAGLSPIRQS